MKQQNEIEAGNPGKTENFLPSGGATCYASSCGRVTLYLGDCLEIAPTLEGVDAVISDPPYGMDWNTNLQRFTGGESGHRSATSGRGRDYGKGIEGDDKPFDPAPWLAYPKCVLWRMHHFAERLPVGTLLTWIKRHDDAFASFLSDAELAWMKGGHGVYCRRDLSLNGETLTRIHPTQKPVPLMAWCMDKAKVPEGATVLDPYMGSGSTIIAAIRTGRKAIGIEMDPTHYATALARIKNELAQGDFFLDPQPCPICRSTRRIDDGTACGSCGSDIEHNVEVKRCEIQS